MLLAGYRWINTLSLDVVAGAIIAALFFGTVLHAQMPVNVCMALGLTVWIIYTSDRLLDVRKPTADTDTFRHNFHKDNFTRMTAVLLIVTAVNGYIVFTLPKAILFGGMILSGLVVMYLMCQRFLRGAKEIVAAFLYVGGVVMPAAIQRLKLPDLSQIVIVIFFFFIVLSNLIVFSCFDHDIDTETRRTSMVTVLGIRNASKVASWLLYITLIGEVITLFTFQTTVTTLVLMAMSLILLMILTKESYFKEYDRYRLLGDAIFFLPAIVIFFPV